MTYLAVRPRRADSLVRSTSQLLAGIIGAQILVAVAFGIMARGLGRPVFGVVVTMLGVVAVVQDLLDWGSSQWLSRELAAGRIAGGAVKDVLRRRFLLTALVAVVASNIAFASGVTWSLAGSCAVYVVCAVGNAGMHARLRASGNFRRVAFHLVGERLAWLALTCAVVLSHPGRTLAASILVAAMGSAYLGSTLLAPRRVPDSEPVVSLGLRSLYRKSFGFGLLGLSSDLQQLDATAAAAIAGVSTAASVGVASKLSGPLATVAGAISQVTFRGVSTGRDPERTARAGLRLAVMAALGLAVLSPLLPAATVFVLGHQYAPARMAILVYAGGTVIAVVNQPLASILAARGQDRLVSLIVGGSVLLGLLFGALTVAQLGAVAMGLGFMITQTLIFTGCAVTYRRLQLGVSATPNG